MELERNTFLAWRQIGILVTRAFQESVDRFAEGLVSIFSYYV